ncbi:MAG: hypothetical protein ABFD91_01805 [Anaerohalosphaeraceae bacterium]
MKSLKLSNLTGPVHKEPAFRKDEGWIPVFGFRVLDSRFRGNDKL